MKQQLLLSAFILLFLSASSQDHQTMKKTLARHLREFYDVRKDNWKIRDGQYVVLNDDGAHIVTGQYSNGKKVGVWTFTDNDGLIVQKYDYDHDSVLYSTADSASIVHADYQIPLGTEASDKVSTPYKIGGPEYGFYLLFDDRDIPAEVKGATAKAQMTYILTINEKGQLESYIIAFAGSSINDIVIRKNVHGLPPEAIAYAPAVVNGRAVRSKISLTIPLLVNHEDVPGTNNIITQHAPSRNAN